MFVILVIITNGKWLTLLTQRRLFLPQNVGPLNPYKNCCGLPEMYKIYIFHFSGCFAYWKTVVRDGGTICVIYENS